MTDNTDDNTDSTVTTSRTPRRRGVGGTLLLGAGTAGALIGDGAAEADAFFDEGPDQLFGIFDVGQELPDDVDITDLSTRPHGEPIITIRFDLVNQAESDRTFDVQVTLTGDATAPGEEDVELTADSGELEQLGDEWPFIAGADVDSDDRISIELEYDEVYSPNDYDDIEITVVER